jgi:hypothetical protein
MLSRGVASEVPIAPEAPFDFKFSKASSFGG